MPLRYIFSRKHPVGLKIRFEVLGDILREWLNDWWLLVLSIVLLGLGLWLALNFSLVSIESARWTMSALVQAGAALMGIFYVALGLLWAQANQETERLLALVPEYMRQISPSQTTNVHSFIDLLSQLSGLADTQDHSVKIILRECCIRLLALRGVALRYLNEITTRSLRKHIRDNLGIDLNDEEEKRIERDEFRISVDTAAFFSYLGRLEQNVDSLRRAGVLQWGDFVKMRNSGFYAKILHKARAFDRVYVSLWKLRFINYFKGRGIIIISVLWLTCLTLGLLTLFTLDRIPTRLLPYISSVPLAIGVIAIGTTLSFGFRAMSVKE